MASQSNLPLILGSLAVATLVVRIVSSLVTSRTCKALTAPPKPEKKPVLVLFASQTGTGEAFARQLAGDCRVLQVTCDLRPLDEAVDFLFSNFSAYSAVIILAATYGEGDAPDNGASFDRKLREGSQSAGPGGEAGKFPWLAICGLGSSEYREFNAFAKRLRSGLRARGWTRELVEAGVCDDAKDAEGAFGEWRQKLWRRATEASDGLVDAQRLPLLGSLGENVAGSGELLELVSADRKIDLPYDATIVNGGGDVISRFYFTSFGSVSVSDFRVIREHGLLEGGRVKHVVHVELDIGKVPALRYKTGDTLEILPSNSPAVVEEILDIFKDAGTKWLQFRKKAAESVDKRAQIRKIFPAPVRVRQALELYCDLQGKPTRTFLRELCKRLEKTDTETESIIQEVQRRDFLTMPEFLKIYMQEISQHMRIEEFILVCPRMKPRSYSIASSSVEFPTKLALTVGLDGLGNFSGLASGFLCERLAFGNVLPHVNVRTGNFRLPASATAPVVMVCAGTGFAPFRGFLREFRVRPRVQAPKLLFYGLLSSQTDLLYPEEISDFRSSGGFVFLAESRREGQEKRYVQAEISDQQTLLEALIARDAHFYVCGSTRMCQAVFAVLENFAGFPALKAKGKYVEEAWG